jgi:hypothetical protein
MRRFFFFPVLTFYCDNLSVASQVFSSTFMSGTALTELWRQHRCVLKTIAMLVSKGDHASYFSSMAKLLLSGSPLESTVTVPSLSLRTKSGATLSARLEARTTVIKTDGHDRPTLFLIFKLTPLNKHSASPPMQPRYFTAV